MTVVFLFSFFFFFNDTATTEIYTLSLHDALPISTVQMHAIQTSGNSVRNITTDPFAGVAPDEDRKSTRLNSSHLVISYAVFCLKKKKKTTVAHVDALRLHTRPRSMTRPRQDDNIQ